MPAQHAAEETDLQVGTAIIAASMKGLVVTWHRHVMGASQATGIGFSFCLTVRKDSPGGNGHMEREGSFIESSQISALHTCVDHHHVLGAVSKAAGRMLECRRLSKGLEFSFSLLPQDRWTSLSHS